MDPQITQAISQGNPQILQALAQGLSPAIMKSILASKIGVLNCRKSRRIGAITIPSKIRDGTTKNNDVQIAI